MKMRIKVSFLALFLTSIKKHYVSLRKRNNKEIHLLTKTKITYQCDSHRFEKQKTESSLKSYVNCLLTRTKELIN